MKKGGGDSCIKILRLKKKIAIDIWQFRLVCVQGVQINSRPFLRHFKTNFSGI